MNTEGTFKGNGGFNLYWQAWRPAAGSPPAVLVIAHGLGEHSGRYLNPVNYFTPRSYEVWSFDLEGHGKSEGKPGYVQSFSNYVRDLETFLHMVAQQCPGTPVFLIGHSMGAPVAVLAALQKQQNLAGLMLSGGVFQHSQKAPPLLRTLVSGLSRLVPGIGVTKLDASRISRDPAVVDAYVNDPLVYHGKVSARLVNGLLAAAEQINKQAHLLTLPLLVMHGAADRMCNPEGSKMFFRQAGSKDKNLKLYDGCYHEIFNEPEREQAFKDMEGWMEGRLSTKESTNVKG